MGKTLRKFSKKGKKTQQRRKTKGKKYGGNNEYCDVGEQIHECEINGEHVNNEHRVQLVNCFNSIAATKFTKDTTDNDFKKAYRKASRTLHPDKGGDKDNFSKFHNAYNGLTECKVQEIHQNTSQDDHKYGQSSSGSQTQRLDITNAIMKKIFGNECDKKHPEPKAMFYGKLNYDDPKILTRNANLINCENNNRKKVIDYLKKREEMENPILTVNDAENVKELEFYNILCIGKADDSDECKKLASLMDKIGGKGKSKKSTRKTKKAKYSKRK